MRKLSLGLLAIAAAILPTLPASAQSWYSSSLYNPYYSGYSSGYANTYANPYTSFYGNSYANPYYGNSYANPYVYGNTNFSAVVNPFSSQAPKNALINRVNAAIQAGQLTVQEGNAILVRGVW